MKQELNKDLNDYLGFIHEGQGNKIVALIPLGDAYTPRVGETVSFEDGTAGATYE